MAEIFECIMVICFGVSWPFSVFKSYKSKSTKGKSLIFLIAITIGYVCGIIGKIISNNIKYPFYFYIFNLVMVLTDLVLFFINKNREKKIELNK